MNIETRKTLLLVTRVATELPLPLVDRAVAVASALGLDVAVLCPVVTVAGTSSGSTAQPNENLRLARDFARRVAAAVQSRGVAAVGKAENCTSGLEATIEHASTVDASVVMVSARHYQDWAGSLIQGGHLGRFPVPLWVQNEERLDGVVLGSLSGPTESRDKSVVDEAIAMISQQLGAALDADTHLLHTMPQESALSLAAEALPSGEKADSNRLRLEARHVAHTHATARRWRIPVEHVHIGQRDLADEIASMHETTPISVLVMGASQRSVPARIFSTSAQQDLLKSLQSDLLLIQR